MKASIRKPVAIAVLLAVLLVWIIAAATIGSAITTAPQWLQLAFYVFAGVAWVLPLRSVFRWMNSAPENDG